jgi:hypothetical protein
VSNPIMASKSLLYGVPENNTVLIADEKIFFGIGTQNPTLVDAANLKLWLWLSY